LATEGTIHLASRKNDPRLTEIATALPGLVLEQKVNPEYWLQRYNQDITAGSPANLYLAEWNREIFELIQKGSTANTGELWKRTGTAKRSPPWLTGLRYGPSQGFIPTSAYIWGLFTRSSQAGSTTGIPATLAELEALFATRKAEGQTPIALGTAFGWPGAAWFTMLDIRMNGPDVVWERQEGKRPFNDKEALTVLQKLAEWRDKGWFSEAASSTGLADATRAVESGKAFCTLLGAYSIDRFSNPRTIRFNPFPSDSQSAAAEMGSLSGFLMPAGTAAQEAGLALGDAYIRAGSPDHVSDSYRIPVDSTLIAEKGSQPELPPGYPEIKSIQSRLLARASALVPAFDRALPPQAIQDSISLWADFFAPGGPTPAVFADRLQAVLSRSMP
jgi:hypothetical protein